MEKKIISTPDPYLEQAGKFIIGHNKASIGMIQRMFKIGFNRAERIMEQLASIGVVGEEDGFKPRKVLMSLEDYDYAIKNLIKFSYPDTQEKVSPTISEAEPFLGKLRETEILNKLGISLDYSRGDASFNKLCNCIVYNAEESSPYDFISFLVSHSPASPIKLILIDVNLSNFALFNGLEILLLPVIEKPSHIKSVFNWTKAELEGRAHKFLDVYARDIDTYNNRADVSIPKIVVIIDEFYNLKDIEENTLIGILQNSSRMGIYFVSFTKFDIASLNLGIKRNLFKIFSDGEFKAEFTESKKIVAQEKDFDDMNGIEFENFCAHLLSRNGFEHIELTKVSGDQGIDIIAVKDAIKYGIQCKCYTSDIGNNAVQEAFSGKAFYNCHVGVVFTNRYFTSAAKDLAKKNGVLLWDREKLLEFAKKI